MRLWLYCLAGFLFDWVLYVLWTVIPIHAEGLGATPLQLSFLQTAAGVIYSALCVLFGHLADRVSKGLLLRLGCLLMIVACLLIGRASSVSRMLLLVPLAGLSSSLFWPALQGAVGVESRPETLERSIGLFNILWSIGKSLGFATAGAIHGVLGTAATLAVGAIGAGAITLLYPWREARGGSAHPVDPVDPEIRSAYLRMAWVANFVLHGTGALIANQYFKLATRLGLGRSLFGAFSKPTEVFFGSFLGLIFLSQTAVFFVMSRTTAWTYRRRAFYLTQLMLSGACISLALLRREAAILALAPIIGVGVGFGYGASIYYSLHTPSGHGKFSGLHEAVLGAGNFLIPLGGGALATALGNLRVPYGVVALCIVAAVGIEEAIYRWSRIPGKASTLQSAASSSPGR